jgi:V/A-type H+-transporting ATPase subunit K
MEEMGVMVSLAQVLAWIGVGLMVGLTGAGAGIGFGMVCSATLGVLKKKPELFGSCLILSAIPSTNGLYGFVAFILYNAKVAELGPAMTLFQGAIVFGAGVAVAVGCAVTCVYQSKIATNGIVALGQGHKVFGNTLILAAYPEFYAILALVAGILMLGVL